MVAPNFSLQDPQYSRLLTVPDDDENEFLTLEELKPHHLTELGSHQLSYQSVAIDPQLNDSFHESLNLDQGLSDQEYNVYYDLNAQQPKYDVEKSENLSKMLKKEIFHSGQCITSLYVDGGSLHNTEMTAGNNFMGSNSSMDTSTVNNHENLSSQQTKGSRKRKLTYK